MLPVVLIYKQIKNIKMYRIIEEKTTVTKKSKFYIQKKIRFLFLEWWSKLKMYHPVFDVELDYDYDTYEDAKKDLDKINDKIDVLVRCITGNVLRV